MSSTFKRWARIVRTDAGLKFASLAVALFLYGLVHGSTDIQRTAELRLDVRMPPPASGKILLTPLPPRVRVTLRGPKLMLDDVRSDSIGSLEVDLRAGSDKRVEFDKRMVRVPPGIKIEQIDPPSIEMRWDEMIERMLPVTGAVLGQVEKGYVLRGVVKFEPARVRVRGPKSIVSVMQAVHAEPFELSGLNAPTERVLPLDATYARAELGVDVVTARVDVAREVSATIPAGTRPRDAARVRGSAEIRETP